MSGRIEQDLPLQLLNAMRGRFRNRPGTQAIQKARAAGETIASCAQMQ